MERSTGLLSTSEVLAGIEALLDAIDAPARELAEDTGRLALLQAAVRVAGRCTALAQALAGEVVATEAAEHAHGTGAASWLADCARLTRREASALLRAGSDLASLDRLRGATLDGSVLPQQARAIGRVLSDLPDDLAVGTLAEAEELMVGYAAQFNFHRTGPRPHRAPVADPAPRGRTAGGRPAALRRRHAAAATAHAVSVQESVHGRFGRIRKRSGMSDVVPRCRRPSRIVRSPRAGSRTAHPRTGPGP